MTRISCFGELLIDMISMNTGNLIQSEGFLKKFGGAPGNTASGLAKLKVPVSFIGKVGDDPFGQFLKQEMDGYGVDTTQLVMSKEERTTLAFVSLTEQGERDFYFFQGAHDTILPSEVTLPNDTFLFHFGSLTQISVTANKTTESLIKQATKQKAILSYDPNVRESLWGDLRRARLVIMDTAKLVHNLKVNEIEAELLTGEKDMHKAANKLFQPNLDLLVITLGKDGCYYKTPTAEGAVPTIDITPVDTTGAGDAFNAGLIDGLYQQQKRVSELSTAELENILKRAVVIGSLTTTKKGAVSAFPSTEEIQQYIK